MECLPQASLHEAVSSGQVELVPTILRHTGGLNLTDDRGFTAVHLCCAKKQWVALNTLLHHGADPGMKDNDGRTPLHVACEYNAVKCCRSLLLSGATWDSIDKLSKSPLHKALEFGNIGCILELLQATPHIAAKTPCTGWSYLHEATSRKMASALKLLSNATPSIPLSVDGPYNIKCLHVAAFTGSVDCTRFLLARRVNPSVTDLWNCTALHWACYSGSKLLVCLLLRHNILTNSYDKAGRLAIHTAAIYGKSSCLNVLLYNSGNPSTRCRYLLRTPLHYASQYNHPHCIEVLLNGGPWSIKVNLVDTRGMTPLYLAARSSSLACCRALLDAGASPAIGSTSSVTPLEVACRCNAVSLVNMLLGPNVSKQDPRLIAAVHHATKGGSLETLSMLMGALGDPNAFSNNGKTALMEAVSEKCIPACKQLINAGARIELTSPATGQTAVHYAARLGCIDILKLFIAYLQAKKRNPVDVLIQVDKMGFACLHLAAMGGHIATIKFIKDWCTTDAGAISPLHCAARYGWNEAFKLLKSCYAQKVTDNNGATPLHWAAFYGNTALVKLIRKLRYLPVDTVDNSQQTPLHKACFSGRTKVVQLLIAQGACLTATDIKGYSSAHCAAQNSLFCLREVVNVAPEVLQMVTHNNETMLHIAVRAQQVRIVRYLLTFDVICISLDRRDSEGLTALDVAAFTGKLPLVEALLPDVHHSKLALHLAALRGSTDIVSCFMNAGFDPKIADSAGRTAAHMAAGSGHKEVLKLLQSTIRSRTQDGLTPLLIAAKQGRLNVIEAFYDHSFEGDADQDGMSFTHYAARGGHLQLFKYLVEVLGMHYDTPATPSLSTPLFEACRNFSLSVAVYILNAPAKLERTSLAKLIQHCDIDGNTALHVSVMSGCLDITRELLEKGWNINAKNSHGLTPIGYSADTEDMVVRQGRRACRLLMRTWCQERANLVDLVEDIPPVFNTNMDTNESSEPTAPSYSVLDLAATAENMERNKIISFYQDILSKFHVKFTSITVSANNEFVEQLKGLRLQIAYLHKQIELIRGDEEAGKDARKQAKVVVLKSAILEHVQKILSIAIIRRYYKKWHLSVKQRCKVAGVNSDSVEMGKVDLFCSSLPAELNINHVNISGMAPVEYVCNWGRPELLGILLRNGANPNKPTNNPPIHMCIANNQMECLNVLCEARDIDLSVYSADGKSVLENAVSYGRLAMVERFVRHPRLPYLTLGTLRFAQNANAARPSATLNSLLMVLRQEHAAQSCVSMELNASILHTMSLKTGAARYCDFLDSLMTGNPRVELLSVTSLGRTALHAIAKDGHCSNVLPLLAAAEEVGCFDELLEARDVDGNTALHLAASSCAEGMVTQLTTCLKQHKKHMTFIDTWFCILNNDGQTALHIATKNGFSKCCRELMMMSLQRIPTITGQYPIHLACMRGCIATVGLFRGQYNIRDRGKYRWTPLFYATACEQPDLLETLVGSGSIVVNALASDGSSALHVACEFDSSKCFKLLLHHGIGTEHRNSLGATALHTAAVSGSECARTLVACDSLQINAVDNNDNTALHLACFRGHSNVIDILLESQQVNLNIANKWGSTPLHYACMHGPSTIVKTLLEEGALITTGCFGYGPLQYAAAATPFCSKYTTAFRFSTPKTSMRVHDIFNHDIVLSWSNTTCTLDPGSYVMAYEVEPPMQSAECVEVCVNGRWESIMHMREGCADNRLFSNTIPVLVNAGLDIDDPCGGTACFVAAQANNEVALVQLMILGADPNIACDDGNTPLHVACIHGSLAMVKILLCYGAQPDLYNKKGHIPVSSACLHGSMNCVMELKQFLSQQKRGISPLYLAISHDMPATAKFLITYGVDVRKETARWSTALHCAIEHCSGSIITLLLRNEHVGPNEVIKEGYTHMHFACSNHVYADTVQLLEEYGGTLDAPLSYTGMAPIHLACVNNNIVLVQRLLNNNMKDIWMCNYQKATPLIEAFHARHLHLSKMLIHYATESLPDLLTRPDCEGRTPLHIAILEGYCEEAYAMLNAKVPLLDGAEGSLLHMAATTVRALPILNYLLLFHTKTNIINNKSVLEPMLMPNEAPVRTLELEKQNKRGWMAIHEACECDNVQAVKMLLGYGCDANVRVGKEPEPVMFTDGGDIDEILFPSRVPLGSTPLMVACSAGAERCVAFFLELSVDTTLTNAEHQSATDIAYSKGFTNLCNLINQSQVNPHVVRSVKSSNQEGLLLSH